MIKNELYDKIYEIVKNDETVYEFGMFEDEDYISLHCLFELDESECVNALKKVCVNVMSGVEEIIGVNINTVFCEAVFEFNDGF